MDSAQVVAIAALTFVLGTVVGVAVMVATRRDVGRRIRFLEMHAERLADGEAVSVETARNDELGRIGQSLVRASERLAEQHADSLRRESLLQAVFAASPDMINIQGLDGTLLMSSPAALEVLGYEPADRVGRTSADLMHPDDQPLAVETTRRLLGGDVRRMTLQYRARHADGHWVTVESHASPLVNDDGQLTGIVAITRDVTPRTLLEQAQQLARAEADAANRSKNEFLSRMSHELRTPLNAVLGFAQVLESEIVDDQQRESLAQILKGGRHLLELINEVLDISRIEAGQLALSPEPVWVSEVLQEMVDLIRPLASQSSLTVISPRGTTCDCYVFADRQRLKQVLLNLLSNAVKYNRARGTIELGCIQGPSNRTRISVTDTGLGIPQDEQAKLFIPFERLGANQTAIEGTGIGLALSQRLAEAMSGTLTAVSTVGQGSTFTVELPAVEGPVQRYERLTTTHPTTPPIATRTRHTILNIEDNLSNLKLIERILAHHSNVELIAAMQGRLGFELARQHQPSLIMLDLHLPDVSGEEVLQQLRDDPATTNIPVIIVSADATRGQTQRLLSAGAAAYITKPINVAELVQLITTHLPDN